MNSVFRMESIAPFSTMCLMWKMAFDVHTCPFTSTCFPSLKHPVTSTVACSSLRKRRSISASVRAHREKSALVTGCVLRPWGRKGSPAAALALVLLWKRASLSHLSVVALGHA